jgi:hypothetical protein
MHVEIRVNNERYGYFVNGRRTEPSWEGDVDGPDVTQWNGVWSSKRVLQSSGRFPVARSTRLRPTLSGQRVDR